MYRCPEQLDLWTNYPIGTKCDIWALGCIIYYLCFQKHPFEDSAKLRIINANYIFPNDSRYVCFHEIIRGCLEIDPNKRFDASMILDRLGAISETMGWSLKGPVKLKGKPIETPPTMTPNESPMHTSHTDATNQNGRSVPNRPAPPRPVPINAATKNIPPPRPNASPALATRNEHPQQNPINRDANAAGSSLFSFSSIKDGAGSLLKNLKDTSSKVLQQVQQAQQTSARSDLDVSLITSRVLVMPCPLDNVDQLKVYAESRYQLNRVSVYNLGPKSCARLPPPVRTIDCGGIYPMANKAPALAGIYHFIDDMFGFLNTDPKSVIIIQSPDNGGAMAANMVSSEQLTLEHLSNEILNNRFYIFRFVHY